MTHEMLNLEIFAELGLDAGVDRSVHCDRVSGREWF